MSSKYIDVFHVTPSDAVTALYPPQQLVPECRLHSAHGMRPVQSVLIVEDDEELRRLYRHTLAMAGFDVREARSGFEALRNLDTARPDVIVLDLLLPGVDGFSVLADLAAGAQTRRIPIVVATGSTGRLNALNVDCVLRKPFAPDELLRAVRRCLAAVSAQK